MLLRILSVVFPIFAIAGIGWAYGRWRKPDMSTANVLNMDLFTPLLIFSTLAVRHVPIEEHLSLAIGGVCVVLGAGLLAWPLARMLGQQPKTLVPPVMFKNSGNMGLPLALLAFGEAAMPAAIVLFLVENFLHFSFGAWLLDHRVRLATLWKVPVMFAGIAGIVVGYSGITIWDPLATSIRMLGEICVPLMLFSLGVRMTAVRLKALHAGLLGAIASPLFGMLMRYAISEDGALHAEKYFRTVSEEFASTRPSLRWQHLVALARVTASLYGTPAPGIEETRKALG